jgi:hypothetical protein
VIRTLGSGLVSIESPQGMAAESASAASLLLATHFGYALSTTHVSTGSLLGAGVGREGAKVRWHVAGRMVITWLIPLPIAALTEDTPAVLKAVVAEPLTSGVTRAQRSRRRRECQCERSKIVRVANDRPGDTPPPPTT